MNMFEIANFAESEEKRGFAELGMPENAGGYENRDSAMARLFLDVFREVGMLETDDIAHIFEEKLPVCGWAVRDREDQIAIYRNRKRMACILYSARGNAWAMEATFKDGRIWHANNVTGQWNRHEA